MNSSIRAELISMGLGLLFALIAVLSIRNLLVFILALSLAVLTLICLPSYLDNTAKSRASRTT